MNNLNKDDEIKVTGVNGFKNNIVSFEDYDAEIRKPLEDEIERLKLYKKVDRRLLYGLCKTDQKTER